MASGTLVMIFAFLSIACASFSHLSCIFFKDVLGTWGEGVTALLPFPILGGGETMELAEECGTDMEAGIGASLSESESESANTEDFG